MQRSPGKAAATSGIFLSALLFKQRKWSPAQTTKTKSPQIPHTFWTTLCRAASRRQLAYIMESIRFVFERTVFQLSKITNSSVTCTNTNIQTRTQQQQQQHSYCRSSHDTTEQLVRLIVVPSDWNRTSWTNEAARARHTKQYLSIGVVVAVFNALQIHNQSKLQLTHVWQLVHTRTAARSQWAHKIANVRETRGVANKRRKATDLARFFFRLPLVACCSALILDKPELRA